METEEPEGGRKEGRSEDNVVPLPRDWLGPREELVPFGPSAPPASSSPEPSSAGEDPGGGDVAELGSVPPLSAQDFWTEESAAIHSALEAPPAPEREPAARRRGGWASARVAFARAVDRRVLGVSLRRAVPLAVALAVVGFAATTAIVDWVGHRSPPVGHRRLAPTLLTRLFSPPALRFPLIRASSPPQRRTARIAGHGGEMASPAPGPVSATTVVAEAPGTAAAAPPSAGSPTTTGGGSAQAVASSAAAPSGTSTPTEYQSHPSAVAHPASSATQSSGGPAGASPASSPSQPAFGAAGALGPGSSPDS